jgi:hypothetical protein
MWGLFDEKNESQKSRDTVPLIKSTNPLMLNLTFVNLCSKTQIDMKNLKIKIKISVSEPEPQIATSF